VKILDRAAQWGYDGVELRFVNDVRNVTQSPEFSLERIKASLEEVEKRKLKVCCVDSSTVLTNADAADLVHGRRCIEIAQGLKAPYVRIFGGKQAEGMSYDEMMELAAEKWIKLADYAQTRNVEVLVESHDHFIKSEKISRLLKRVNHSAAGVLWDVHHPYRMEGESIGNFWNNLGPHIRHVHVKDSRGDSAKHSYCLCGEGDIPIRETVQLLKKNGWSGWINLEWELTWHPELAPAETAMPQYREKLLEYLKSDPALAGSE